MKSSKITSILSAAAMGLALTSQAALAVEAVAVSGVNVRSGPGVQYQRVDTLFRGEDVNITECQGNWCYVEHPGPDGWVSANYLAAANPANPGGTAGNGAGASNNNGGDAAAAAILGLIIGGVLAGAGKHNTPPPAAATPPQPPLPYGPDTCKQGYVWRDAIPGDHVCVTPQSRAQAAHENAIAGSRVNPTGPYGPNSCKVGYVWREAYNGDKVCVTGARRAQVRNENLNGPSHRVRP